MKNFLSALLVIILSLSMVLPSFAGDLPADEQKCGENLYWSVDGEGNLTITGTGEMYDYDVPDNYHPWGNELKSISLGEGITYIGEFAFYGVDTDGTVGIPAGVIAIGDYAFYCSSLPEISFPKSLESIGYGAFEGCYELKKVAYAGTKAEAANVYIGDVNYPFTNIPWLCSDGYQEHEHWANCDEPEVCIYCGANHDDMCIAHDCGYFDNEDGTHTYRCRDCAEEMYSERHRVSCDDETRTCVDCGSIVSMEYDVNYSHGWPYLRDNKDGTHSYVCSDCGTVENTANHIYDENGSCYCGAQHECEGYTTSYRIMEWGHCEKCNVCGCQLGYEEEHDLDENGICTVCEYDSNCQHENQASRKINDVVHEYYCMDCGCVMYSAPHYRYCDGKDGICVDCGAVGVETEVTHGMGLVSKYDKDSHWYACEKCGEATEKEAHRIDPESGECTEWCGYCLPESNHWHEAWCNSPEVCRWCLENHDDLYITHDCAYFDNEDGTHTYRCKYCTYGEQSSEKHRVSCDDETRTCQDCGAVVDVGYDVNYSHGWSYWRDNKDGTHSYVCSDCGTVENTANHIYDENGSCYCGAQHECVDYTTSYRITEWEHREKCNVCGCELGNSEEHVFDENGICTVCEFDSNCQHENWAYRKINAYQHEYYCEDCGCVMYSENHSAYCDSEEGECIVCGAEGIHATNIYHTYTTEYDKDSHWGVCEKCGEISEKEEHRIDAGGCRCGYCLPESVHSHEAWCDSPEVCRWCLENHDDMIVIHDRDWFDNGDGTHIYKCKSCGTENGTSELHQIYCDDETRTCAICGATVGPECEVKYLHDNCSYRDNEDGTHSYVCECGEVLTTAKHRRYCDEDKCEYCGADVDENVPIDHRIPIMRPGTDNGDGTHSIICTACKETVCIELHTAACGLGGTCIRCGAKSTNIAYHNGNTVCINNGDGTHSFKCNNCNEIYETKPHNYSQGMCECGAKHECTDYHELYELDDYSQGHYVICDKCLSILGGEPHYIINGACQKCGFDENKCGLNLSWSYKDQIFTVTGTGDMFNWGSTQNSCSPLGKLNKKITSLVLPAGLTSIGDFFTNFGQVEIEELKVPSAVNTIGERAFRDITSLKTIYLPKSLEKISAYAFDGCKSLTDVYYDGTEDEAKKIAISGYNMPLLNATWHYGVHKHDMSKTEAKAATCTTDGNSAYWTCKTCGKYFADAEGKTQIEENSWVIKATGHQNMTRYAAVDPTCDQIGHTEHYHCWTCDKYFSDSEGKNEIRIGSWVIMKLKSVVTLDQTSAEILTNKTLQLKATVKPERGTSNCSQNIRWSSSNENIATVDKNGKVTALHYGKATITATSVYGQTATCNIQVLFNDVPKQTGYPGQYVYWAAERGIVNGFDSGVYFGPKQNCTRSDMMIMLYRVAGQPAVSGTLPFTDCQSLSKTSTRYKAILWGYTNGIVKGYSDGTFGVDSSIVRKDTMIMLYRMAGKPNVSGKTGFPDVDGQFGEKTDTYKAILWGVRNGITSGYKASDGPELAGKFGTGLNCLREHIATFVCRYSGLSK